MLNVNVPPKKTDSETRARIIYLLVCFILIGLFTRSEGNYSGEPINDAFYQEDAETISAASFTYYAIGKNNTLYAWGDRYPQSTNMESAVPILYDATLVSAGWRGCLAIDDQHNLWSVSEYLIDHLNPLPYQVMNDVKDVSVGLNHFICLTTKGDVYVCGRNSENQLTAAVEVDQFSQYSPPVYIMSGVKDISACDDGCFVLTEDGDLFFWGTYAKVSAPKPVLVGRGFDSLSYGIWAIKDNDLYIIAEEKGSKNPSLTTERILENVDDVYAGVVRMLNGEFYITSVEDDSFQKISLPKDITYACYTYWSNSVLVRHADGSIEQVEVNL